MVYRLSIYEKADDLNSYSAKPVEVEFGNFTEAIETCESLVQNGAVVAMCKIETKETGLPEDPEETETPE